MGGPASDQGGPDKCLPFQNPYSGKSRGSTISKPILLKIEGVQTRDLPSGFAPVLFSFSLFNILISLLCDEEASLNAFTACSVSFASVPFFSLTQGMVVAIDYGTPWIFC